jgi:hypothetical protein
VADSTEKGAGRARPAGCFSENAISGKTILIYFAPQARNSPEGLFAAGAANSAGEGGGKVVEENGFSVTLEAASGWFLTLVFKIFKALGLPRALNRAFYARL